MQDFVERARDPISRWLNSVMWRRKWMAGRGIPWSCDIAPSRHTYGQRLPRLRRFVSSFPRKRFLFPPLVWEFFRVGQKCQQWESHHLLRFWDLFTLGIRKSFELLFLGARVEQSQSCATFLCVNIENSQLLIYCIYLILTLVRFNLKFRKTACVIDAQTCRHKRRSSPISFLKKEK